MSELDKLQLTKGAYALIDHEDYEELSKYKWHLHSAGYAGRVVKTRKRKYILMHRQIMNAPDGVLVDHVNGDPLDNRKENLRLCTHAQNLQNRRRLPANNKGGYIGVFHVKEINKWEARITVSGKRKVLGYYSHPEHAAVVRDMAAWKHYGEFAFYNEYK